MTRKVIDLSRPIFLKMHVYPGTPKPVSTPIAALAQNGYRESLLQLSSHTGTHLDAPSHMVEDGAVLDRIDVDRFFGKARVLDCSTCGPLITKPFLEKFRQEFSKMEFLLIYTGWEDKWESPQYFTDYPVLTPEAACFLSGMGLKGIGVDAISVDSPDAHNYPVHLQLLNNNILIVENLTNLSLLRQQEFMFACFPLPLKDGEASPIRAVGIVL